MRSSRYPVVVPKLPCHCIVLLCAVLAAGCDEFDASKDEGEKPGAAAQKDVEAAVDEAVEDANPESDDDEEVEDKGRASVEIDGETWTAQRARARVKEDRVSISASWMERDGKDIKRQEVKLSLKDFDGPGEYELGMMSMFVSVGMNLDEAQEAADDDAKTAAFAKKAIGDADNVMLRGGTATVTAVTDDFIDGTFEWTPGPRSNKPKFENGRFHARIKK